MVIGKRPLGAFSTNLSDRDLSGFSSDPKERHPSAQPQEPLPLDQKVVGFINSVMTQATDFSMVGPMLLAAPASSVGKLSLLKSMVAHPGAGFFSRLLKLKVLPILGGFAAETAAFGLSSRALNHYFHGPVPWDPASVGIDLGMAGLTLGLLKGAGYAGTRAMQWARGLDGLNPLAWTKADHRALFLTSQLSAYLGLVASHGLQNKIFPEVHLPGQNIWVDALGAHLALGMGAYAGRRALGERFHAMERGSALEAHRLYEQSKPTLDDSGWPATDMAVAAAGRAGRMPSRLDINNYYTQRDKGAGSNGPTGVSPASRPFPYSEKISSGYLGTEIETELVSNQPIHNLKRLSHALRESLLDILISGQEEGIPLKGEIVQRLRQDGALRKRILGCTHLQVRFDATSGEILEIHLSQSDGAKEKISAEGEEILAAGPPQDQPLPPHAPETGAVEPAEGTGKPKSQPPTADTGLETLLRTQMQNRLELLSQLVRAKWPGKETTKFSLAPILKNISRGLESGIPPAELEEILTALETWVNKNKSGDSTPRAIRNQWRSLRKKFSFNLWERPELKGKRFGKNSPSVETAKAGPEGSAKEPETVTPAEEAQKDSSPGEVETEPVSLKETVSIRINRLQNSIRSQWPGYPPAKRSAGLLLGYMAKGLEKGLDPAELAPVLETLEESIHADQAGSSTHEEAVKLWRRIKEKYSLTFYERPDLKGNKLGARSDSAGIPTESLPSAKELSRAEETPSERGAVEPTLVSNKTPSEPPSAVESSEPPSSSPPPPEAFRYQHAILNQLIWMDEAGEIWRPVLKKAYDVFEQLSDDQKVPPGAARNRAAANFFYTLKMRWAGKGWPGLGTRQMEGLLEGFQKALDGGISMDEYYRLRRDFQDVFEQSAAQPVPVTPPPESVPPPSPPIPPRPIRPPRAGFDDPLNLLTERMQESGDYHWDHVRKQAETLLQDLNGDHQAVLHLKDALQIGLEEPEITPYMIRALIETFEMAWATNQLDKFQSRINVEEPLAVFRQMLRESSERRKKRKEQEAPVAVAKSPKASKPETPSVLPVKTEEPPAPVRESSPLAVPAVEMVPTTPQKGERAGLLGIGPATRFFTTPIGMVGGRKEYQGTLILPNLKRLSFLFQVDAEGKLFPSPPGRGYWESPDFTEGSRTVSVSAVEGFEKSRFQIHSKNLPVDFQIGLEPAGDSFDPQARMELAASQPDFEGPWEPFFAESAPGLPQTEVLSRQFLAQNIVRGEGGRNHRYRIFLNNGDTLHLQITLHHHGHGSLKIRHARLQRLGQEEADAASLSAPPGEMTGERHKIRLQDNKLGYKMDLGLKIPVGDEGGLMEFERIDIKAAPPPVWLGFNRQDKAETSGTVPPPPPSPSLAAGPEPKSSAPSQEFPPPIPQWHDVTSRALEGDPESIRALGVLARTEDGAWQELRTLQSLARDSEDLGPEGQIDSGAILSALKTAAGQNPAALAELQAQEFAMVLEARQALVDIALSREATAPQAQEYLIQQLKNFRADLLESLLKRHREETDPSLRAQLMEILGQLEVGDRRNPNSLESRIFSAPGLLEVFLELADLGVAKAKNTLNSILDLRPLETQLTDSSPPSHSLGLAAKFSDFNPKALRLVKKVIQTGTVKLLSRHLSDLLTLAAKGGELGEVAQAKLLELSENHCDFLERVVSEFGNINNPRIQQVLRRMIGGMDVKSLVRIPPHPKELLEQLAGEFANESARRYLEVSAREGQPASPSAPTRTVSKPKTPAPGSGIAFDPMQKIQSIIAQKSQGNQKKLTNSGVDYAIAPYLLLLEPSQILSLVNAYKSQLFRALKNKNSGKSYFYLDLLHRLSHHLGAEEKATLARQISKAGVAPMQSGSFQDLWNCLKSPDTYNHVIGLEEIFSHKTGETIRVENPYLKVFLAEVALIDGKAHNDQNFLNKIVHTRARWAELIGNMKPEQKRDLVDRSLEIAKGIGFSSDRITRELFLLLGEMSSTLDQRHFGLIMFRIDQDEVLSRLNLLNLVGPSISLKGFLQHSRGEKKN